jgi:hypothetical protein
MTNGRCQLQPLKDAWSRIRAQFQPKQSQAERSTPEQMKDVIDLAEEFDRLQGLPVWEKVLKQMAIEVQAELVEATKYRYEPVRQMAHTVRWDAKRELLDNVLAWIDATQTERLRIIEEFKRIEG